MKSHDNGPLMTRIQLINADKNPESFKGKAKSIFFVYRYYLSL